MTTSQLDMLYEPGGSRHQVNWDDRPMYARKLCTGCKKEDTRCENCGAKLRTEDVPGLAVEMRPCGFGGYPPDEHTAERCKNRREAATEAGLLPSPTIDGSPTARPRTAPSFTPESFNY